MTCRDCIHYKACNFYTRNYEYRELVQYMEGKVCDIFEDKSRFVELPCKVGDTFYTCGYECIIDYECLGFQYGFYNGNENTLMLIAIYGQEFIFGEEAFLTKEEAEQALKEKGKRNERNTF